MKKFTKFHSLGNDFLIIDRDEVTELADIADLARKICERHTGVGADGLLVISVTDKPRGIVSFRIFNADGSEAEISGNGLRCAAAFLYDQKKLETAKILFQTTAGDRECELVKGRAFAAEVDPRAKPGALTRDVNTRLSAAEADPQTKPGAPSAATAAVEERESQYLIKIDLGAPRLTSREIPFDDGSFHERIIDYPLMINRRIYPITVVSIGNPHCGVFVDRFPARIEWHEIGREIEGHPFFPNRTNIEFIRVHNRKEIEVLFWERGVGETLSSGSGSTAAAVASILKNYTDRKVTVKTSMGQVLVEWEKDKVFQTGPAEFAFTGSFMFQ